ncbi:MAG: GDSL-type esterase/lipase family protein [Ruminococcus sp.]
MNDSSIISALKSYILLIGVAAASVILMIVFFIQKNGSDTNGSAGGTSASISESAENIHQPATFAAETTDNNTDMQPITDISEPGAVPSEPAEKTFTHADDSYFSDALFIGNSRTVGLYLYGSMPEETTFYATVGMNIYDLLDSTAQIPPEEGPEQSFESLLSSRQFGKIYIMLGINDLSTGTSESFAEYYKSIIDHIHEIQPNAIIYIQSIINISAARDAQGDAVSNANINEKNALLRHLENKDYIFYLDINEVLSDENGFLNSDYTSDGIHLGGGSVSIWEDYLYSHAIAVQ